MIRSLALFLTPVEQKRCCLAKKEIRRYRPGLFLQGFLIQDDIYDELIDANLIQSPYPTTIVDLHQGLVLQGNRYNIFVSIRKEQMVHEVVESDDPLTIPPQFFFFFFFSVIVVVVIFEKVNNYYILGIGHLLHLKIVVYLFQKWFQKFIVYHIVFAILISFKYIVF